MLSGNVSEQVIDTNKDPKTVFNVLVARLAPTTAGVLTHTKSLNTVSLSIDTCTMEEECERTHPCHQFHLVASSDFQWLPGPCTLQGNVWPLYCPR